MLSCQQEVSDDALHIESATTRYHCDHERLKDSRTAVVYR